MNSNKAEKNVLQRFFIAILAVVMALGLTSVFSATQDAYADSDDPNLIIADGTNYSNFVDAGDTVSLAVVPANSSYAPTGLTSTVDGVNFTWTSADPSVTISNVHGTSGTVNGSPFNVAAADITVSPTATGGPVNVHVTNNNTGAPATAQIDLTVVVEPATPEDSVSVDVWVSARTANGAPRNATVTTSSPVAAYAPADPSGSNTATFLTAGVGQAAQNYATPTSALGAIKNTGLLANPSRHIAADPDFNIPSNPTQQDYGIVYGLKLYYWTIIPPFRQTFDVNTPFPNPDPYYGWQYRVYDSNDSLIADSQFLGASVYKLQGGETIWWQYGPWNVNFPASLPSTPPV